MSEQDADTGSEGADGDSNDLEGTEEPEDVTEQLSEIAEEPDGDVDVALSDVVMDAVEAGDVESVEKPDPESVVVDEALVEKVDAGDPETVALAIELLRSYVDALESATAEQRERAAEFESRLKRKQADFQNYKQRQEKRMEEEIGRATEDLVTRLLDVRDNLDRALQQDEDADIRGGVESTLEQFDRELDRENVSPIEPEPGEEVDPQRHEVLVTIASDQPEDRIAQIHRTGYEMAGKVLRPAQVAVSDGSVQEDRTDAGETEDADEEDA